VRNDYLGFVKTLYGYVRDYLKRDVNWIYFSSLVLILSALVAWFYSDKQHLQLIGGGANDPFRYFTNLALYGGTLTGALLLYIPFARDKSWVRSKGFWATVLFAVALYSFAIFCYWHKEWIKEWTEGPAEIFWLRCASDIGKIILLAVPVTVWWLLHDRSNQPLYGFRSTNVKPYLWLLAMILPFIVIASFTDGFQKMYPMVTRTLTVAKIDQDIPWYTGVFEFFYGLNYVNTEFFFRGFLILALSRWLGPHIILPVAAFYVTIHIGKPLGETISSFFGGIILGVLAYRTQSIWGGVIIHVGIAFAMELFAAIARGGF
jgi:membrane protease YdiL (CAAX protease family)